MLIKKPGAIIIEGHVQGLSNTRSLGELGIPVIVVDKHNCIARYSRYCKAFYRCPSFEKDELAEFLLGLGESEMLHGWVLIPSNDHAVLTLSRNKEKLEQVFKVITPGVSVIQNIYDKSRLLRTAEKLHVPIPATYYTRSTALEDFDISFPVLTKGRQGLDFYKRTGKKAFLAQSREELEKQIETIARVFPPEKTFIQELIPDAGHNKTLSFAAFCVQGEIKTHWVGEKLREHPVRFGTATFCRSVVVPELLAPCEALIKELNYTGVCEIEFLQDPRDQKFKLIEINARTWLWVGLAKACGINFPLYIFQHANDKEYLFPNEYRSGLHWINYLTDLPFSVLQMIKGKMRVSDYFNSLRQPTVDALLYPGDNKPWFVYLFMAFRFLRSR